MNLALSTKSVKKWSECEFISIAPAPISVAGKSDGRMYRHHNWKNTGDHHGNANNAID